MGAFEDEMEATLVATLGNRIGFGRTRAKKLPTNLATLDHLRDRNHPDRLVPARGEQRLVIACWQCNHDRGRSSEAAQPIESLWEKSKRRPLSLTN